MHNSNIIDFKNLELIPELLEKLSLLEQKLNYLQTGLIKPLDLSTRKNVREYLNISESTLSNMFKDGRLKQGKHYTKQIKGNRVKIIYIAAAIKELKK